MFKRTLLTISIIAIAFSLYGCKKKAATPEPAKELATQEPVKEAAEPTPEVVVKPVPKQAEVVTANLVKISTSMGDITAELYADKSPITVKNFLGYIESGFYNGTLFHRVIKGFMIQGGGFTPNMQKKTVRASIKNETQNQVRNTRGTLAMARRGELDSATSQFFINHADNKSLDFDGPYKGYAVFGKVVSGMDVVDAIAMVSVTNKAGMENVPVKPVIINSVKIISN